MILRLAAARDRLSSQHGSQLPGMPPGDGQHYDWTCPINACSYYNFGRNSRCLMCEARPAAGDRMPKGGGKGKGNGKASGKWQFDSPLAKGIRQKLVVQHKQEVAELKRQLREKDKRMAGDCDEKEEEEGEDVSKELEKARKKKSIMRESGAWGEHDPEYKAVEEQIQVLVRKRVEGKPQRVQIQHLERTVGTCQKQVETRRKEVEAVEGKITDLMEQREEKLTQLASVEKELERAKEERKAGHQRAIDEETKAGEKNAVGTNAREAMEIIKRETIARLPADNPTVGFELDKKFTELLTLLATLSDGPFSQSADASGSAREANLEGKGPNDAKQDENGQKTPNDSVPATTAPATQPNAAETQGESRVGNAGGSADVEIHHLGSDSELDDEDLFMDMDKELEVKEGEASQDRNKRITAMLSARLAKKKKDKARQKDQKESKRGGGGANKGAPAEIAAKTACRK